MAAYPDGKDHVGITGLRDYLRAKRHDDFLDNLTKKLFTYALGRSLTLSDRSQVEAIKSKAKADHFAFGSLVEGIVFSPQFLNKR